MKRVYKIIFLFVSIFLIGIFSFGSYINSYLKKSNTIKAVEIKNDSIKNASANTYYLN